MVSTAVMRVIAVATAIAAVVLIASKVPQKQHQSSEEQRATASVTPLASMHLGIVGAPRKVAQQTPHVSGKVISKPTCCTKKTLPSPSQLP